MHTELAELCVLEEHKVHGIQSYNKMFIYMTLITKNSVYNKIYIMAAWFAYSDGNFLYLKPTTKIVR